MNKFDHFYMGIARDAAKLSYAEKLKVGSVAIRGNNILAFGYNGSLPGDDNTCEHIVDGQLVTKDEILHSEENLILKLAQSNTTSIGATIYISHSPCVKCSRMIVAAGFTRLVYGEEYRDTRGLDMLERHGVKVEKYVDSP